jgi:hypothetical protein
VGFSGYMKIMPGPVPSFLKKCVVAAGENKRQYEKEKNELFPGWIREQV